MAGLSDKPQVMLGDMTGLLGNKRIALKKFTNFVEFSTLFPEYNFVLVGDSGQGDAALGELIYNHYPSRLKGVFLHNISGETTIVSTNLRPAYFCNKNLCVFASRSKHAIKIMQKRNYGQSVVNKAWVLHRFR